ncbi:piggyBac transposable element-derived protein 4-like [Uloborus diversus]|uniref:piggyBac transposable element-derived protein 4-like n=1 Tax=Uloborus diversus TaxID=327109 RepID=UPI00240A826B|nr:piggyBac transposable element-derived protein 4-like [Uloborus diversus]
MSRKRRLLSVKEALEYMQELSENESEDENYDHDLFSEEYAPSSNEECESSDDNLSVDFATQFDNDTNHLSDNQCVTSKARGKKRKTKSPNITLKLKENEEIFGIDGSKWKIISSETNDCGRISQHNVCKEACGPTSYAKRNIDDEFASSSWRLIINESMLRHIKMCTEEEAHRQLGNNDWTLKLEEIDAFIAILYARGLYCAKGLELDSLWSTIWGPPFFRETMARDRFRDILRFLRFDQKTTRSERLKTDKFCLISKIWYMFTENSINCYKPGPYITVDEQLFPTKARCKFTQYMPNKPDKFGIKFWIAADADTKYIVNGFPYLGKDKNRPTNQNLCEYVVLNLIKPFENKGRNVTTDNYFTTLNLAKILKEKKTSLIGTVKRNRREVPTIVKKMKTPLHETTLLKHDDITMTVYQGKQKKNVILLSSLHPTVHIGTNNKKMLPETVSFYNTTKCGVDVADQMARKYTVKAGSRRWPVHVFYNILDLAGINSWILYKQATGKNISRKEFLQQLVEELRATYISTKRKRTYPGILQSRNLATLTPGSEKNMSVVPKRVRCHVPKCNNKTVDNCFDCKNPMCGKCIKCIKRSCVNCV